MQIARIYLRVSTDEQELTRENSIIVDARAKGFHVAGVYKEKASGARADRPELQRMIADLQPGEVVVAEKIDRISRLPLTEAEQLIGSIKAKGAKLAILGIVDLFELAINQDGVARIVPESVQDMLLKVALQTARNDYETRRERQRQGVELVKASGKYKGRRPEPKTHELNVMIAAIVDELAPELIKRNAIGYESASQLLITAGDNPQRLRSESGFAALCGASPVPVSSGKTNRYRLNRGEDRAANSALHIIAIGPITA